MAPAQSASEFEGLAHVGENHRDIWLERLPQMGEE